MTSQMEFAQFMTKLMKSAQDIKNDFSHLSPENQARFAQTANQFLRGHGYAITIEDLLRMHSSY